MRRLALAGALALAPVAAFAQTPAAAPVVDSTILLPQDIGIIAPGQLRHGVLEAGDWTMGDGTWADVWYLVATAGQRITIELRSRAFDAYMQLLDPSGRRLVEDDDSAGGNDARITFTAPADGRYQIVVNTYGDEPQSGRYTLAAR